MSDQVITKDGAILTVSVEPPVEGAQVVPDEEAWRAVLPKYGLRTLQEIVNSDYAEMKPLVDRFLSPGETALLIARQKEGKSTLALQLAIDVSRGDSFLGRYQTQQSLVLYVDYENRPHRLKDRGTDVAKGRVLDKVVLMAYDFISDRDIGLFGEEFAHLREIIGELRPGLLIIDPLRYAIEKDTSDERTAIEALDQISRLKEQNPVMAVLLVHHLKKAQDNFTPELRSDPRAWVERMYGSQALLAHVETIWGLEHDDAGYALGTVSRSEDSFVLALEKESDSERFCISAIPVQVAGMTQALRQAWERLPQDFSRSEALALEIPNNTLDRLIRHARPTGLLVQDSRTKRYRKANDASNLGKVGNLKENQELSMVPSLGESGSCGRTPSSPTIIPTVSHEQLASLHDVSHSPKFAEKRGQEEVASPVEAEKRPDLN